ncbi:REP element-mobilizing transposase RayT [Evansella caseinilytica]|uniref:REP element-mobilizing transposase RayT n=1 Tax=Evansella caseinilytica TaxID=1503961 RepID=A0A1H3S9Z2_9BACI|nr:transposase [Evansella caseinilytica]SDZ33959.1 REP element-mobilizing transposase RayT [Evansella caseinilytica]
MPTPKRAWYPGAIYHVISRGVRRTPIFLEQRDFEKFITILNDTLLYSPYHLHAYCLMTNHYHLLIGTKDSPLRKIMHSINGAYATWFNKKYNLSGHVFENRYSCHPVPSDYGFMSVSAYIHNNPRAAKICSNPFHYPWSSYHHYALPDIVPDFVNKNPKADSTIAPANLFFMHPDPRYWSTASLTNRPPRSPPKAFTKERLRQLFPTPLHLHYPQYVDREWKLSLLQKSNAKLIKNKE